MQFGPSELRTDLPSAEDAESLAESVLEAAERRATIRFALSERVGEDLQPRGQAVLDFAAIAATIVRVEVTDDQSGRPGITR